MKFIFNSVNVFIPLKIGFFMSNIILVEGTDGSGKETQSKLLEGRLNLARFPAERINIPAYDTPTGKIVGQCYLGKDLGLGKDATAIFGDADSVDPKLACGFYALDRYAAIPEIKRMQGEGKIPILDRWVESNMGHQGGKIENLEKRVEMFEWIRHLEYDVFGLPKPTIKLFFYMPLPVSLELRNQRAKNNGEKLDGHESNLVHMERAEQSYLHMLDLYPKGWHRVDCAPDGTIDSLRTPENISDEVYSIVSAFF
jgi:dTMP kinase